MLNIAQQTSEVVKQNEAETPSSSETNKTRETHTHQWTKEEKLVNSIVAGVFVLAVLALLWRITMKEPEE